MKNLEKPEEQCKKYLDEMKDIVQKAKDKEYEIKVNEYKKLLNEGEVFVYRGIEFLCLRIEKGFGNEEEPCFRCEYIHLNQIYYSLFYIDEIKRMLDYEYKNKER